MNRSRIHLHIDRLVLDESLLGGEPSANVRVTIERELARLLRAPGSTAALLGIGVVDRLPPAQLAAARQPTDVLGVRMAAAIGRSLGISDRHSTPTNYPRR